MAIPVAAPALLFLKRRAIGALLVVVGIAIAAVGFLTPLAGSAIDSKSLPAQIHPSFITISILDKGTLAILTPGNTSGLDLLKHTFDHPLLGSGNLGSVIVDSATRAGVVLIAGAALLVIAFNVLPLMRGLVGVAAGIGLMGAALELGVIFGERARTASICAANACQVDPRAGAWLMAIGFAVALAGGALGALRPLAGLVSGLSFACVGVVLGAGVAYLISQQHVLDIGAAVLRAVPH